MYEVNLELKGKELSFELQFDDYTRYIDDLMNSDTKSIVIKNSVIRWCKDSSKDSLKEILKSNPSMAMQIATIITKEVAPQEEIVVKK